MTGGYATVMKLTGLVRHDVPSTSAINAVTDLDDPAIGPEAAHCDAGVILGYPALNDRDHCLSINSFEQNALLE